MQAGAHPTSAFVFCSATPEPVPIPAHHTEMWKFVEPGLKVGRTYAFASCCATIHDNRKKSDKQEQLDHPHTKSLYEVLGKRRFGNEAEFSSAMTGLEQGLGDHFDQIAFNRNHASTQSDIKIARLEKRIEELDQRVTSLEAANQQMKKDLETERRLRLTAKEICLRAAEKSDGTCILCKSSLPDLLPN